jgi:hypothetical protein
MESEGETTGMRWVAQDLGFEARSVAIDKLDRPKSGP